MALLAFSTRRDLVQAVTIEPGANPPIVTVTALALVDGFRRANEDQGGKPFLAFMVMVGHFVNPARFPLPQAFVEVGMVGPPDGLAGFFEGGVLSDNVRKALELVANEDNADQSQLAAFIALARRQFGQ